jgi:radical SAM protein with 4Fe4S-binding SPASM domain
VLRQGISRLTGIRETAVSITYNTAYASNLDELVSFAVSCGAKHVNIDFCRTYFDEGIPVNDYVGDLRSVVSDVVGQYDQLNRITDGHITFQMSLPFCLWPTEFIQMLIERRQIISLCHVFSRRGLVFDTAGKLLLCNSLFAYPLGQYGSDFETADSLVDFINQPDITRYHSRITSYPSQRCMSCDWYDFCGGGCPLRWASYNPDELVKEVKL